VKFTAVISRRDIDNWPLCVYPIPSSTVRIIIANLEGVACLKYDEIF